ncbi:hypothetical protein BOTBODRAFT_142645 [Botryobasidium botryosum FD-172 SS1]|uniref:F-box domain-containing protein n=1 Tax=Botryobasidium botryosum (strain FD-172 SS1) TaxID=930990 RepID=A0A067MW91_BOTB1|nr:hypothetical protein BOTBODRAFT_142645 [Botryobasidium botryosum FD-172 SS1]
MYADIPNREANYKSAKLESAALNGVSELLRVLCRQIQQNFGAEMDAIIRLPYSHGACSPRSGYSNESSRERIDREYYAVVGARDLMVRNTIALCNQQLSDIKTRRNNLSPAYRLPTELLTIIFEYTTLPPINYTRWRQSRFTLLSISHVSKLWREIAINTPTLWSKFDVFNIGQPFANVCFARSKNTLLDLELYDETEAAWDSGTFDDHLRSQRGQMLARQRRLAEDPLLYRDLMAHMPRWRSLKLAYEHLGQLSPLSAPAPHLEVFHLNNANNSDYADYRHSLPCDIFDGRAPRLRDLKANHVYVSLAHPIITSLTSLCLKGIDYTCSSVHELLRALERCPLLERLELARLLLPFPDETTPTSAPIALPNLRDVVFVSLHPVIICRILSSVVLPPTSRLKLLLRNPADLVTIFASNTPHLEHFSRIRSLFLDVDDASRFRVRARASDEDADYLLDVRVGKSWGRGGGVDTILRALGKGVGVLSNVEIFSINTRGCVPSTSALTEVLSAYSTVTHLSLGSIPCGRLEALLATSTARPCPVLRNLRIHDWDDTACALVRVVESRRKAVVEQGEASLQTLELENCVSVDGNFVLDLESLGVEVTVKRSPIEV